MNFTAKVLDEIFERTDIEPLVFVETGTYNGDTTALALHYEYHVKGGVWPAFTRVITIDLSSEFHSRALRRFSAERDGHRVECLLGYSEYHVPRLAREIDESVLWYLDAHWCRGANVAGTPHSKHTPLWIELQAIASRVDHDDIVVVDDVHAWGGGSDGPAPFWSTVNVGMIVDSLGPHRVSDHFRVSDHEGHKGDQHVFVVNAL